MSVLVTSGATLVCTMGTNPSVLAVLASRPTRSGGKPVATIADSIPMANIPPFGACRSGGNPAVASATAAAVAQGRGNAVVPMPCIPNIPAPWTPGSSSVMTGNVRTLHHTCRCACQWGGVVSIVSPGQQTTTVG